MAEIGTNIDKAALLLTTGKPVAIPTETVYGLAANALDERAVLSVFEVKERPFFDPLIIHVHNVESVHRFCEFKEEKLMLLANAFWPGPLTLLLKKRDVIPDLVTSGLPQVAVRIPRHPLTLALLEKLNFPLAAPSANPFGYISPTEAAHVQKQLGDKIEYILDGGPCGVGLESTIVSEQDGQVIVHRLGGLAVDEIERVAGKVKLKISVSDNPLAPGQLKSHYAPRKKLYTGDATSILAARHTSTATILTFARKTAASQPNIVRDLSPHGDLREAAMNLFKMLRAADEDPTDIVICDLMPEEGLGLAINDRLKRAAA